MCSQAVQSQGIRGGYTGNMVASWATYTCGRAEMQSFLHAFTLGLHKLPLWATRCRGGVNSSDFLHP